MPTASARFFKKQPPSRVLLLSSLFLVVLFYVDVATGPDLRMGVFFLLPVTVVSLLVGRRGGAVMAVFCAVAWLTADMMGGAGYKHPLVAYVNGILRLLFFLF